MVGEKLIGLIRQAMDAWKQRLGKNSSSARDVAQLLQDVKVWNAWREKNPSIEPNLSGAGLVRANLSEPNLSGANLSGAGLVRANLSEANLSGADLTRANLLNANLSGADLHGANLSEASLVRANLSGADLRGAKLIEAKLSGAKLSEANLTRVNLFRANLFRADLFGANLFRAKLSEANLSEAGLVRANLSGADLRTTTLVDTDLTDADLTDCHIYGVSTWKLKLEGAKQQNLVITDCGEPEITVDNIEVAQFIYLLLHNQKIRDVIDTITSKAVLIRGRFRPKRKKVLDALRDELRNRGYLPILFDFEGPSNRNTDETIMLLARMARFVIADISDARSVLQELREIVPNLPNLPVQPVIVATQEEPGLFDFYRHFHWFLKVHRYDSEKQLIADLSERVIRPAEDKVLELRGKS